MTTIGYKHTQETKQKISKARKIIGAPWNIGRKRPDLVKRNRKNVRKGEQANNWRGGISTLNNIIRSSPEYKLWRIAVFARDNYTCIWCGKRSMKDQQVTLHADHIKPFAHYPELRFAIDNGRTLCIDCHKTTDTYAGKSQTKRLLIKELING